MLGLGIGIDVQLRLVGLPLQNPIGKTGIDIIFNNDIVKAHGGEIKVETNENDGTSFNIILPNSNI